jgi:hypothetical protein
MLSLEQHLDNLIRHIELVREACILLGKKLIANDRHYFGRLLIAKGFEHDTSKFYGIEWDYLHSGRDVPKDKIECAIRQHVYCNDHHPEFWNGVDHMPEIALAEMVCDWYARSQEFGTCLRDWINTTAVNKYQIDITSASYTSIQGFVDLLLEDPFIRADSSLNL